MIRSYYSLTYISVDTTFSNLNGTYLRHYFSTLDSTILLTDIGHFRFQKPISMLRKFAQSVKKLDLNRTTCISTTETPERLNFDNELYVE